MVGTLPTPKLLFHPTAGYIAAWLSKYGSETELLVNKSPVVCVTDQLFQPVAEEVRGTCAVLVSADEVEDEFMVFRRGQFFTYRLHCKCPGGAHYCNVGDDQIREMFTMPESTEDN